MQFLKEGVSYTEGQENRPICDRIQKKIIYILADFGSINTIKDKNYLF